MKTRVNQSKGIRKSHLKMATRGAKELKFGHFQNSEKSHFFP